AGRPPRDAPRPGRRVDAAAGGERGGGLAADRCRRVQRAAQRTGPGHASGPRAGQPPPRDRLRPRRAETTRARRLVPGFPPASVRAADRADEQGAVVAMRHLPGGVRAVFFDAVGTLIHPEPSAAEVYAAVGARYGSRLPAAVVRRRFAAAFQAEERLDAERGHRTDEDRERQRWRDVVAAVLDDVSDPGRCFDDLYEHFARPQAWRIGPGAARGRRDCGGRGGRAAR